MIWKRELKAELNRLKLNLFGSGNDRCLNMPSADFNTTLGLLRVWIRENKEEILELKAKVSELEKPKKVRRRRPLKKK